MGWDLASLQLAPMTKRGRQMQNLLLAATWHPHHQVPKACASWSLQGALTCTNGVSADLLSPTDAEYFIGCHLAPTPPVPETKRCRPCASWSPQEALTGTNEVWVGRFHGTLRNITNFYCIKKYRSFDRVFCLYIYKSRIFWPNAGFFLNTHENNWAPK